MRLAEINGRPATAGDLAALAFAGYGHFTSMQLRDGRVRGFDLHLARLRESSRELFGEAVDDDRVRGYLRRAVRAGPVDASVQVNVFASDDAAVASGRPVEPDVLVRTGPPATSGTTPVRVRTTRYQRLLPHIKHVATLGLVHHWRLARQAGFDDVLFVDPDGFISEGSIWNVAFFDGAEAVWPSAPALRGITMQLVQAGLAREGVGFRTEPVHRLQLGSFRAAALMNSVTAARPLASIDDVALADTQRFTDVLQRAYQRSDPQAI